MLEFFYYTFFNLLANLIVGFRVTKTSVLFTMSEKVGYARVSTESQNLDLQIDALKKAGCIKIFTDTACGAGLARNGLTEMLKYVRKGDCVVIYKLDRLGRSLINIIKLITIFEENGIELISLTDNIDTKTPMGRAIYKITATFAELERDLIRERTVAGLKAARSRGRLGGRPPSLTREQIDNLKTIYNTGKVSVKDICNMFKLTKPTMYRYLKNN